MKNYLLFDSFINDINSAPFEASALLLTLLDIPHTSVKLSSRDVGYHLRYKYNITEIFQTYLNDAKKSNIPLIALENSSFLGLKQTNEKLNLQVKIIHVNDILLELSDKFSSLQHDFKDFNVGIYYGSDDESLSQEPLSTLLHLTKAKEIFLDKKYEDDGFQFLKFDKTLAYKMAADILFDAYDNSCDFIVVNDIRSFHIFDAHQKAIAKSYGRSLENGLPILSISQILLMALGKIKPEETLVHTHAIKPTFLQ